MNCIVVKACLAALSLLSLRVGAQDVVDIIANQRLELNTPSGTATIPLDISANLTTPQPEVTRAIILLHGKGRDADGYYRGLARARREAHIEARSTLLIAPQFLNQDDARAHVLPNEIIRWRRGTWESGATATGPAAISAYEVLDALLLRLADRRLLPNLRDIVLAGHSGGAQAVQRYAVVGTAIGKIKAIGVHIRFVIANPSSYLYFSDMRPATVVSDCHGWNHWKYGTEGAPSYVRLNVAHGWKEMESNYATEDVIYLLGSEDTDPREKDLDLSCGAEAEGATRLARGLSYFVYLKNRNSLTWNQRLWIVDGVGHSGPQMVDAPCGVKALFGTGQCDTH